jgi:predicted  nucleic acid-binding Zn-ribbon protein
MATKTEHTKLANHDKYLKQIDELRAANQRLEKEISDLKSRTEDGKQLCKGYQDMLDEAREELEQVRAERDMAVNELGFIGEEYEWCVCGAAGYAKGALAPPGKPVETKTKD